MSPDLQNQFLRSLYPNNLEGTLRLLCPQIFIPTSYLPSRPNVYMCLLFLKNRWKLKGLNQGD